MSSFVVKIAFERQVISGIGLYQTDGTQPTTMMSAKGIGFGRHDLKTYEKKDKTIPVKYFQGWVKLDTLLKSKQRLEQKKQKNTKK